MKKRYKKIFLALPVVSLPTFLTISCVNNESKDNQFFNKNIDFSKSIGKKNSIIENNVVNEPEKQTTPKSTSTNNDSSNKPNKDKISESSSNSDANPKTNTNNDSNKKENELGNEDKNNDTPEKENQLLDSENNKEKENNDLKVQNISIIYDDTGELYSVILNTNKSNWKTKEALKYSLSYTLYNDVKASGKRNKAIGSTDDDKPSSLIFFEENIENYKNISIDSLTYNGFEVDLSNLVKEFPFPKKQNVENDAEPAGEDNNEATPQDNPNKETEASGTEIDNSHFDSNAPFNIVSLEFIKDIDIPDEVELVVQLDKDIEDSIAKTVSIELTKYINETEMSEEKLRFNVIPVKRLNKNTLNLDIYDLEPSTKYKVTKLLTGSNSINLPNSNTEFMTHPVTTTNE
ncbi:hypothetical protein MCANPG14_02061 [Mycoplasmopsis canis PG 14]|uniref:hypothetical protein n=1 Tax=Mycoplasmopsis canis TaxID=29555 RepID=UPI00025AE87F|nr:hypothetical protein [Mycoplasmopsis canis]EIE39820.1 hypothetical protein MCANPG14_02061 [Mycoplasmopsis canis PG 14]